MAATPPAGLAHDGVLARRDRSVPTEGSADSAGRAPVVVLATAYSGVGRLRSLLDRVPDLAWTSGTGIVPLCEQAAAVWRNADGRPEGPPSRLAVTSTRALVGSIITAMLAREGKRRWCEVCSAMPEVAEAFLRLYPATRFVCLYRSCGDVIRAVLDASPWGISDPAFAPFTRTYPASTVAAVAAYWAAHTASLLAFEQSHPQVALRIRFEDLDTAGQQTVRAVMSFLGTAGSDSDAALAPGSQAWPEPGTPHAKTGFPARPETDLPAGLVPPAVLTRANDLLRQLDYPALPE
jgi:hypothetical protein